MRKRRNRHAIVNDKRKVEKKLEKLDFVFITKVVLSSPFKR